MIISYACTGFLSSRILSLSLSLALRCHRPRGQISLTGDYILSELISPGRSGQFFYFSYDLRFMLKTITRGEAKFLKAILPSYYSVCHPFRYVEKELALTSLFGAERSTSSRIPTHLSRVSLGSTA